MDQHFNSRPHGGRHRCIRKFRYENIISTHALTEGDAVRILHLPVPSYFNSRPHGGRHGSAATTTKPQSFQLTPSRRATSSSFSELFCKEFQLTPSRRATTKNLAFCEPTYISTHALTEGDYDCFFCGILLAISTHALTEGDSACGSANGSIEISTHALTEGDEKLRYSFPSFKYFNSRPHGGRPSFRSSSRLEGYISTHALTEGDCAGIVSAEWSDISTHALTEGDLVRVPARLLRRISTHALTEGDKMEMISGPYGMDFNSRPHGGRPSPVIALIGSLISTHALTEGDGISPT